MKIELIGNIFNEKNSQLNQRTHFSVPCAEFIENDIYQIYFSSRDLNNRSQTYSFRIDINNPFNILDISSEPILSTGRLGNFDEHGSMSTWIYTSKNLNKKYMYYIGWNTASTMTFRNSIGLAIDSGKGFQKYSEGPIIDRGIYDPCFVASCCILDMEDYFKMWYLSCGKWEKVNGTLTHYYNIKTAISTDLINWKRDGHVAIDFKNKDEYAISRPSVLLENGIYKMWYSFRGDSYDIGYAESEDGHTWERKDELFKVPRSNLNWDSEMIEYPNVFKHKNQKYLLYNGNDYGKTGIGLALIHD